MQQGNSSKKPQCNLIRLHQSLRGTCYPGFRLTEYVFCVLILCLHVYMNFSDSCGVSYCRDTTPDTGTRVYACWSPHQSTREKERDLLWLTVDQLVLGLATQSMRVNQVHTYIPET